MLVVKDVLNCNACLHSADIVVKQFLPHEPFSNFLQGSEGFTRVCPVPPCSLHHPPHMHACVCAWRCSPHRHNTCTQCASLFSLLFSSFLFSSFLFPFETHNIANAPSISQIQSGVRWFLLFLAGIAVASVYVGIGKTIEMIQDKRGEMLKSYIDADDLVREKTTTTCYTKENNYNLLYNKYKITHAVVDQSGRTLLTAFHFSFYLFL